METSLIKSSGQTTTDLATRLEAREKIECFAEAIAEQPGALFGDNDAMPLKHTFTPGIYVRELFLPKGYYLVGKIHKEESPHFLLTGKVQVFTEQGGLEEVTAPTYWVDPPGSQRALYVVEDARSITIHHNPDNETDLEKLEDFIVAKSFKEIAEIKRKELI
jgi:hypothetical protein